MPDGESKAASPSASHAASQTGARADQALFAEALQAAEELQNVASYGTPGLGATSGFDRIDALLLEEIEAEDGYGIILNMLLKMRLLNLLRPWKKSLGH